MNYTRCHSIQYQIQNKQHFPAPSLTSSGKELGLGSGAGEAEGDSDGELRLLLGEGSGELRLLLGEGSGELKLELGEGWGEVRLSKGEREGEGKRLPGEPGEARVSEPRSATAWRGQGQDLILANDALMQAQVAGSPCKGHDESNNGPTGCRWSSHMLVQNAWPRLRLRRAAG